MKKSHFILKSVSKGIVFLAFLSTIPKTSSAQYSTGFFAGTSVTYLYVGSLGPSNAGNLQKIEVDILGGGWTSATLGKTTYTIANRDNLIINQTTEGGSNGGNFTMKVYSNPNGNTDFYVMTIGSYPAFAINSIILNTSGAQSISITQSSSPPNETDITPAIVPILITDQNGNIALNTTSTQGYKFAVNGTAIATAMTVKLNANWPDYVFKKKYQLQPLSQLRSFIDLNHHLPDVPSAEQVAKDGINLGDMSKITLQKIEELTLYLIEKDKQLADEKETNKQQQQQIDSLKQQINLQAENFNQLKAAVMKLSR